MKRVKVLFTLGGLLLLGVLALLWARKWDAHATATYQGRTVEEWLYAYYRSATPRDLEIHYLALKELREHSIPILAEMCVENARPTRWERILEELRKKARLTAPAVSSDSLYNLSRFALQIMDPSAREILPGAEELFDGGLLVGNRNAGISMVQFATRDQEACVPLLRRAYLDGIEAGEIASEIARELFKDSVPPADLLAPLIQHLRRGGPNFGSMDDSYHLLGEFGRAASNSVDFLRPRFESEANRWVKASIGVVLVRVDPSATDVLDLLMGWALDPSEESRSAASIQLSWARRGARPSAERILAGLDGVPEPHLLEDVLVRMFTPDPAEDARVGPLGEEDAAMIERLVRRFHNHLSDPGRTNALNDRLNPAWRILRLDPSDARAWEVFRS